MAYIELEVSDVQSSQAQGEAFALILKEKGGDRFVPVVIGISEARAVVFELNRIKPHRPGLTICLHNWQIIAGCFFIKL